MDAATFRPVAKAIVGISMEIDNVIIINLLLVHGSFKLCGVLV